MKTVKVWGAVSVRHALRRVYDPGTAKGEVGPLGADELLVRVSVSWDQPKENSAAVQGQRARARRRNGAHHDADRATKTRVAPRSDAAAETLGGAP